MDTQKIAARLKSQRESMGLTIPTVVDRTRIKRSYIEALESGNFSVFDNAVYIRNFVRTYARFLKIPESEIMPLLTPADPSEDAKPEKAPAPVFPRTSESLTGGDRRLVSTGILIAAGLAAAIGFFFLLKARGGPENQPASTEEGTEAFTSATETPAWDSSLSDTEKLLSDTSTPSSIEPATAPPAAVSNVHKAEMTALSEVWLSWETEQSRFQKLMRTGEKHTASFEKNLRLIVGNPGGLKLSVDGADVSLDTGKVFDRIFRVREDGVLVVEPATSGALRRFQSRQGSGSNP